MAAPMIGEHGLGHGDGARNRTPSPYTFEQMDGNERFLDLNRRKIERRYNESERSLHSHYEEQLHRHYTHYADHEQAMVESRTANFEAIQQRFVSGTSEAVDGHFHRAARTALEQIEQTHALPGFVNKTKSRSMAQKRWAMIKVARLLGSLRETSQPQAVKSAKESKSWKKLRVTTKVATSLKGAQDEATLNRLAVENSAARRLRQRTFRGAPPGDEVEWTTRQLRLLYLVQLLSSWHAEGVDTEGWCRRIPLCVWIFEAIGHGVLNYTYHSTSQVIGGRRCALNTSAEAMDDLDRLCAGAMLKSFRRPSRTYTSTTAYQVTIAGKEHLESALSVEDLVAVHGMVSVGGVADNSRPGAEQLFSVTWDVNAQCFWISHPQVDRRKSLATSAEDVSYVSSPHIPTCLRDRSKAGGKKDTSDNRDRLPELQITKKSTALRIGAQKDAPDAITLHGVRVIICEWLPLSTNHMTILNERLGSGDTVQGGFFSDQIDEDPEETVYVAHAQGLTSAHLLDFDELSYVNYEAEVFLPTSEGVIQIEHIGVHFDDCGLSTYGLRIDGVEAKANATVDPAILARVLVDVRVDSSHLVSSVLEQRQKQMLELLHMADHHERDKYNVIFAEHISPLVKAQDYIDGKHRECELQQLLGELSSSHELAADTSAATSGAELVLIFGRRGVLLAGENSLQYEPLLVAHGDLKARSIVLRDMCTRILRLNDEVTTLRDEITVAHRNSIKMQRVRSQLCALSMQCVALSELHKVMCDSLARFEVPNAPNSSEDIAGALLFKTLKLQDRAQTMVRRASDVSRALEAAQYALQSLRAGVNAADSSRLLRSQREVARNTMMCADIVQPVLGTKLIGLTITFAGLLAIQIVDTVLVKDSPALGVTNIVLSLVIDPLDQVCGPKCTGIQRYTGPLALVACSVPYALCWWVLSFLLFRVWSGRQELQGSVTSERLRIDRRVNTLAVAEMLQRKNVTSIEVKVQRPSARAKQTGARGRRIVKYSWKERAALRWNGMPPFLELEVDLGMSHLKTLIIHHQPLRSGLTQQQVREQVLSDIWRASPRLFATSSEDVDIDDWVRFSTLDDFIGGLVQEDEDTSNLKQSFAKACGDPGTRCGALWQWLL